MAKVIFTLLLPYLGVCAPCVRDVLRGNAWTRHLFVAG